MVGVIWVVQLGIYPLFNQIGRAGFIEYHRLYMARISLVVMPLMGLEAVTAGWLLIKGLRSGEFLAASGMLPVIWLSTFLLQVPLHRKLSEGFDPAVHRQLVLTNWVRTVAWTVRAGLLFLVTP